MFNYLVDFKDDTSENEINEFLIRNNATIIKEYNFYNKTYLINADSTLLDSTNICDHIIDDDITEIIPLESRRIIISDPTWGFVKENDPDFIVSEVNENDWWKIAVMHTYDFSKTENTIKRSGSNCIVYVMDSGIKIDHPEFIGSNVENLFTFNGSFEDFNGHGTAIASVINGQTCGITNAQVKSVKIYDPNTTTKQSHLLNALEAIYYDAVNNSSMKLIVNCSWVISKNDFIESKIRFLCSLGILFVCSAGNNGGPIEDVTPAAMDEILTIGSYNSDFEPCDFSNYTYTNSITTTSNIVNYGKLDGWAPGERIYAATLDDSYSITAGTSISAGIHSAVLAYNMGLLNSYPANVINQSYQDYSSRMSLAREGLLNLQDEKYSSSVNKISSVRTSFGWNDFIQIAYNVTAYSGGTWTQRIVESNKVKQIEIIGDIPEGVEIYPSMQVYGTAPIVEELYVSKVIVNVTDLNDEIHTQELIFAVLPLNWDDESTSGDPDLDVKLQACSHCYACPPNNYCEGPPDFCCNGYCCTMGCVSYYIKNVGCSQFGDIACICYEYF